LLSGSTARRPVDLRHGANSASTAKVTRTRTSGGLRGKNLFGAARRNVAVVGVPADGSFERRGDRAGLEAELFLRALGVDEHHVLRDFHTLHGNSRLTAEQT